MCEFPSWKNDNGKIWFCTDKDVLAHEEQIGNNRAINWADYTGHNGIDMVWGNPGGVCDELFPCPVEIASAINRGEMRRIMAASGVISICVDDNGRLHSQDNPAIEHSNGTRAWYLHGKIHRLDSVNIKSKNVMRVWYARGNYV